MNVKLTKKDKIKVLNSDDVFDVMQKILIRENKIDRDKEHFWIIGLACNNKILFIELVSMGSTTAATVEPMNVFRVAVMKNAVKVALVHNHPSGGLKPSEEDKDLTDRLIQVGKILNVEVIEHLIISIKSYLSFVDIDLLQKLQESTTWMPNFALAKKIRREEQKIKKEAVKAALEKGKAKGLKEGEEKGLKKGKIEIAKVLIKEGLPFNLIKKSTGLSKKEIEKLSKSKPKKNST